MGLIAERQRPAFPGVSKHKKNNVSPTGKIETTGYLYTTIIEALQASVQLANLQSVHTFHTSNFTLQNSPTVLHYCRIKNNRYFSYPVEESL